MNAQQILDALLNSGKDLVEKGVSLAEAKLDIPDDPEKRNAMMTGASKGALAAGALALLLGTRTGRKLTGTTLKLGSLAAIGGVAYSAFETWKSKQGSLDNAGSVPASQLTGEASDRHSRAILKAMIAAAKVDGHIDDNEKNIISQHAEELGVDGSVAELIKYELTTALDVNDIAADADSPEMAAEIYLVSRVVLNVDNEAERQYLEALSKALKLDDDLVAELEKQAGA
jgi:uncharacterized membrane protein YebE (DUF533 family)